MNVGQVAKGIIPTLDSHSMRSGNRKFSDIMKWVGGLSVILANIAAANLSAPEYVRPAQSAAAPSFSATYRSMALFGGSPRRSTSAPMSPALVYLVPENASRSSSVNGRGDSFNGSFAK